MASTESIHNTDNSASKNIAATKEPFFAPAGTGHVPKNENPFFKPVSKIDFLVKGNPGGVIQRASDEVYEGSGEEEGGHLDYIKGEIVGFFANRASPLVPRIMAAYKLDKGLPQSLLNNYAYGDGKNYYLSLNEMKECIAGSDIYLSRFPLYINKKDELLRTRQPVYLEGKFPFTATKGGTLNQFTIVVTGYLSLNAAGNVILNGHMFFYDWYDFDFHEGGRSAVGQFKSGFGNMIPGTPFMVISKSIAISAEDDGPVIW